MVKTKDFPAVNPFTPRGKKNIPGYRSERLVVLKLEQVGCRIIMTTDEGRASVAL